MKESEIGRKKRGMVGMGVLGGGGRGGGVDRRERYE